MTQKFTPRRTLQREPVKFQDQDFFLQEFNLATREEWEVGMKQKYQGKMRIYTLYLTLVDDAGTRVIDPEDIDDMNNWPQDELEDITQKALKVAFNGSSVEELEKN